MGDSIIIDSDVLIDFLRKKPDVVKWFEDNKNKYDFTTTIVNVFELYTGAFKSFNSGDEIKKVSEFLKTMDIFDLTLDCAKEAGKQRANLEKQGNPLESRDILIGAIAITNNLLLKTNNKKHFERIEGLKLAD
ncbi:PIN domain nuclease [Candidatus Pacearchaeota archaeon]|nr:PIN domain nuclease [Candidatus Pacearchaeota archaeon]|tara:strand:+ start:374 stop:772 length:399 start_codon:yes stop_codon:yes gene_type:complete